MGTILRFWWVCCTNPSDSGSESDSFWSAELKAHSSCTTILSMQFLSGWTRLNRVWLKGPISANQLLEWWENDRVSGHKVSSWFQGGESESEKEWERLRESEVVRKSEMVPKPQCAPVAKWQRFCTALLQKSQHFEKRQKIHFKKWSTSSGSFFVGWIPYSADCNLFESKLVDSVST